MITKENQQSQIKNIQIKNSEITLPIPFVSLTINYSELLDFSHKLGNYIDNKITELLK